MRSMWAWAGFQFCQAGAFLSIYVCKFFANVAKGESQAATQNHYLGVLRIRDQKFTTIQGAAFNSNGIGSKVWAGSLLSIRFGCAGRVPERRLNAFRTLYFPM